MSGAEPKSIEEWAERYILSDTVTYKLGPGLPPSTFDGERRAAPAGPGRPSAWRLVERAPRIRGLGNPKNRAALMHRFLHHELQAAELMAWAILRFPESPERFRRGLLGICLDEIRHMNRYAEYLASLGFAVGDFPVRDWFWERIRGCESPAQFAAFVGVGLEGGNLDHSARYAERFREAGDELGATIQDDVGREEIAHVRFALRWFGAFVGEPLPEGPTFRTWCEHLPGPLSPILFRGSPLARAARREAGLSDAFVDALEGYVPDAP